MDHNQASALSHDEVAKLLETDLVNGLSSFEARERLKKFGANNLESDSKLPKTVPRFIYKNITSYLSQFKNPLIQLLLLCVIISAIVGEYENAASVALAICLVCTISHIQERRADKSLDKLNKQMPNTCKVIRESVAHELEARDLVPGDIVYLSEGQRVPADVRLFELHSLTINEANLTGETQAQSKMVEPAADILKTDGDGDDKNFVHQNLALMGTMVEFGHSKGVVISTGRSTRYGQVYCLLKSTQQPPSPLQLNIDQLSLHLVVISCSVIALTSMLGIVQQRPAMEVAYYAISLAVTAIPEGLPVVVAVIMALGVMRLSKRKTIVRSLASIETLGCVQVLCADKTGTLTRDDMTLTDIVTSELHSLSSGELEELNNEECKRQMTFNKLGGKMYSIGRLMEVGTLCNNAFLEPLVPPEATASAEDGSSGQSDGHAHVERAHRFVGQATECAILDASMRMGFGDSRTKFDRLQEIPFEPRTRRMAVQCRRSDLPQGSSGPMFYVKGAWEEILADCSHYYECGLVRRRTEDMWAEYARVCTALGAQGLRVLALATGPALDQLTFVGVVGISNAPREGIEQTLSRLQRDFHIEVKMITGDSLATALAVGRALRLVGGGGGGGVTGSGCREPQAEEESGERAAMSGEQVRALLASNLDELAKAQEIGSKCVFYRVDPVQKANIVGKLQELNKVVAMTGDGVNDVISLKKANLSLVMGSGADVCKEIADVIMVDNDLSVLAEAVVEGKGIYHKIHSFLSYQISISLSLLCLIGLAFASRSEPPFTVIQLLFLNLLTDGPPAQALGMEKVDERELNLRPRNVRDPLINCSLLRTLIVLTSTLVTLNGVLYYFLLDDGKLDDHAKSLLFTCYVFCSIFAALTLRSKVKTIFEMKTFGNKEILCVALVTILVQIAILGWEPLNNLFGVENLTALELIYLFVYAASVLVVMDTFKVLTRLLEYLRGRLTKECCLSASGKELNKQPPKPEVAETKDVVIKENP